jgi:hypothetical protein
MKVTEFNIQKIDDELLNILRSNLNYLDIRERIEEKLKLIKTTTDKTYFISNRLNFIKEVKLDNNILKYGFDYIIHWRDSFIGSIELINTPADDLDLEVLYGETKNIGSFIYPDMPRDDLGLDKYPRIGFKISWIKSQVGMECGSLAYNNEGLVQIRIVAESTTLINKIIQGIDDYFFNNFKNFYSIRYIEPKSISNYDNFSDNTDKPFSKTIEYSIPHKYQTRGD